MDLTDRDAPKNIANLLSQNKLYADVLSKAFVISFSEAIGEECRGSGVHVMVAAPGPFDTRSASTAQCAHDGRGTAGYFRAMNPQTARR